MEYWSLVISMVAGTCLYAVLAVFLYKYVVFVIRNKSYSVVLMIKSEIPFYKIRSLWLDFVDLLSFAAIIIAAIVFFVSAFLFLSLVCLLVFIFSYERSVVSGYVVTVSARKNQMDIVDSYFICLKEITGKNRRLKISRDQFEKIQSVKCKSKIRNAYASFYCKKHFLTGEIVEKFDIDRSLALA